jgi:hypothetical protein
MKELLVEMLVVNKVLVRTQEEQESYRERFFHLRVSIYHQEHNIGRNKGVSRDTPRKEHT